MLPYLFLLLGFHLISPGSVLSSPVAEEDIRADNITCDDIFNGAKENFETCTGQYFTTKDIHELRMRDNVTRGTEYHLMCRHGEGVSNCIRNSFKETHQCFTNIKHIRLSFFLDLLDNLYDFYCQNDLQNLKDVMSGKDSDCKKKSKHCDDTRIASFFFRAPINANITEIPDVDYTERVFCRELIDSHSCAAEELKECSETIAQTMNNAIAVIKNSTSCAEFYVESNDEEMSTTPSPVE